MEQEKAQVNDMLARLFVCLFGFLTSSSTTRLYRGRALRQERLTILRAATHETELGDHDFCLSRSHYTDTDPTCRERAATAGIEPGTSSPGVARSTAELPRPPCLQEEKITVADNLKIWTCAEQMFRKLDRRNYTERYNHTGAITHAPYRCLESLIGESTLKYKIILEQSHKCPTDV